MIFFLVIATICWENYFLCQWVKGYSLLSNLTGLVYLFSCWSLNSCGAVFCIVIRQIDLYGLLYTQPFDLTCTICWIFCFFPVCFSDFFKKMFCMWICVQVFHFILLFNVSVWGPIPCCLIIQLCLWYNLNLRTVKSQAVLLVILIFLYIFPYEDEFVLSRFVKIMLGNWWGLHWICSLLLVEWSFLLYEFYWYMSMVDIPSFSIMVIFKLHCLSIMKRCGILSKPFLQIIRWLCSFCPSICLFGELETEIYLWWFYFYFIKSLKIVYNEFLFIFTVFSPTLLSYTLFPTKLYGFFVCLFFVFIFCLQLN